MKAIQKPSDIDFDDIDSFLNEFDIDQKNKATIRQMGDASEVRQGRANEEYSRVKITLDDLLNAVRSIPGLHDVTEYDAATLLMEKWGNFRNNMEKIRAENMSLEAQIEEMREKLENIGMRNEKLNARYKKARDNFYQQKDVFKTRLQEVRAQKLELEETIKAQKTELEEKIKAFEKEMLLARAETESIEMKAAAISLEMKNKHKENEMLKDRICELMAPKQKSGLMKKIKKHVSKNRKEHLAIKEIAMMNEQMASDFELVVRECQQKDLVIEEKDSIIESLNERISKLVNMKKKMKETINNLKQKITDLKEEVEHVHNMEPGEILLPKEAQIQTKKSKSAKSKTRKTLS